MSRQQLLENGFWHVENVLDNQLLQKIRELGKIHSTISGVKKHSGIRQPHALKLAPFICELFSSQKLKDSISEAINTTDWYVTNHADLHTNALSGWHKDDGMSYGNGGYFKQKLYHIDDPNVFKVAIYLQDHLDFEDGLKVIPGSHRTEKIQSGIEQHMGVKQGDVIIFDTRLSHTGQISPIPKATSDKAKNVIKNIHPSILEIKRKEIDEQSKMQELLSLFRKHAGTRQSVFFTFAADSEWSKTFAIENMKRQLVELPSECQSAFLPPRVRDTLKKYNVNIIDQKKFWQDQFQK